jgi:hypothetical protein
VKSLEQCRHFVDGRCVVDCNCCGSAANCEYIDKDTEGLSQDIFLFSRTLEILDELREHMTCSLPCIYCKKQNSEKMCDGKFEWIYEKRIREIVGDTRESESD